MKSTKWTLLLALFCLVATVASVVLLIRLDRARAQLSQRDREATGLRGDLERVRSDHATELDELRREFSELEQQTHRQVEALRQQASPEVVEDLDSMDPNLDPEFSIEDQIGGPFVLPDQLPPDFPVTGRAVGQLLHEVSDGFVAVGLLAKREELPLNEETLAVYKEVARLHAILREGQTALVRKRLEAGDYLRFDTAIEVSEYTHTPSAGDGSPRVYFEVIEDEDGFLVIDISEHRHAEAYQVAKQAVFQIVIGDDRFDSIGASHHPFTETD